MNKSHEKLKRTLAELDFAIHETILYLDVYPNNKKALNFYKNAVAARQKVYDEYVTNVGPLFANDVRQNHWSWTDGPWPWQN